MKITKYNEINDLLIDLIAKVQAILGQKLVGIYLYGSLVWGDFDYDVSDIDLLVVTETDIDKNDFAALDKMQSLFVQKYISWNNRIEILYISKNALKTFRTQRSQIAVISPGELFNIKDAGADWLLNWYFVRENSISLFGPDPKTIIDPISKDEYLDAVKIQALGWYDWIIHTKNSRAYQSYAILTLCRALYALHNGEQVSKKKAALWAEKQFPQWVTLIGKAMEWRTDHQNQDVDPQATYPEVEKCIHELVDFIRPWNRP